MKICVVSSTILPCPPPGYGGLEQVAWLQAKGLAERGHEVLLVAPEGSTVPPGVELHQTTRGELEMQAYSGYWQRLPAYDAIWDHSWAKWSYILKAEGKLAAPVLGVLHAPANTMYERPPPVPKPCLVAISQDQATHASELWGVPARVAYNPVDLDFYQRRTHDVGLRRDRYLFLARISTIKGPHIAVDLARTLRFGLDIVGDDALTHEPELAQRIRAAAVHNITYHGPVSRDRTVDFYSSARAHLHMNLHFREPFGLAPVEAQACGLPVIAFDNGAMRETIVDGESGYLVKRIDEVAELIKANAVGAIRGDACRESAARFSVKHAIDRYEALTTEAIDQGW